MIINNTLYNKLFAITAVVLLLFGVTFTSNASEVKETSGSLLITGGALKLDVPNKITFDDLALGSEYNYSSTSPKQMINVNDATGTGDGFNVTAEMGDFVSGSNTIGDDNDLSLTVKDNDIHQSSINVLSKGEDGMGSNEYDLGSFQLKFDASKVKAGTYTSTITYTLSKGP